MHPSWVGDGMCDDVTNIIECDYDGGDCCMSDINTQYCEECLCHSSTSTPPLHCNSTLAWMIGDGFCDDVTNNQGKKGLAQKTCTVCYIYNFISPSKELYIKMAL